MLRLHPTRVRTSPKKLTFNMEAARNFYEVPDDTLQERDGRSIQQRTRIIEEEKETSSVSSNSSVGGFPVCQCHIIRYDLQHLQDKSDELSEDSEDETVAGSSFEGDVEMEVEIISAQSVRWCYCHDKNGMTSNPQHVHTFLTPYVTRDRPKDQYKVVYVFNQNCAIMEDYERQYFVDNSIQQNNRALVTALGPIVEPILYSAKLAVAQVTWKLESVVAKQNEAREFVQNVGLPDYNNRHCRRLLGMASTMEDEVHDVMVHTGATLYEVVMELLIMTRFTKNEDVQQRYRVTKDQYRNIYPVDPWKNSQEEYIEPTATDRTLMLKKIDKDLVEPAMDMLDGVKENLNHALETIYDWNPISTRYQKLKKERIHFSTVCMNAAAMLEISAMYLIYMASGRDEATLGSSVNVFGGRNQFLKVVGPTECQLCGNEIIDDDEMSI